MTTRRNFLLATGSALWLSQPRRLAWAQSVLPTNQTTASVAPTLSEQLMHTTVRLSHKSSGSEVSGTGFIVTLFQVEKTSVTVIVTNRHVVEGLGDQCTFTFAKQKSDGSPDLDNHIPVTIDNFSKKYLCHETVDLAIIPISWLLNDWIKQDVKPYYKSFSLDLIPTDAELHELTAIEPILTVGFPGQLWDNVHDLPVFHSGYTATAPFINFKGNQEFLIDIATWLGSSGSPVMLFSEGPYENKEGGLNIGRRFKLLGVVYGVALQDVRGQMVIQNAPTQVIAPGVMSVPTNLGACIDASRILEFEPLLVSKGFVPPTGYTMRAKPI